MAEVTMPRLSDTMSEGTIGKWLKQQGDQVSKGDVLVEIETDKATMELEAYEEGVLQQILVADGETVPIGQAIALIGDGNEQPADTSSSTQPASQPTSKPQPASPSPPAAAAPSPTGDPTDDHGERVLASPLARRIAEDRGINLRQVQGTGPNGRIIRENVEAYQEAAPASTTATDAAATQPTSPPRSTTPPAAAPTPSMAAPAGSTVQSLSRMRRAIAQKMTEAKHGTPHFYVTAEIAMDETLALRKQINDSHASSVKISVNDFIIKAMAKTLAEHPELNRSYVVAEDGTPGIVEHPDINISVAMAVDEGLIVPVVAQADKKSLGTIAAEVKELATLAREGSIKQHQLEGGTFTVSNLGMYDVTTFTAIITPPQAGVLAIGSILEQPVVRDHELTIGHMMYVTLSADHRVVDGATAARCLHAFKRMLQSPLKLLV